VIATVARWVPCVVLALLAVAAGGGLVRELTRTRPLPSPPVLAEPAPIPVMVVGRRPLGGPVETAQYMIIAMRNLFSASRSESTETTTLAATRTRPFLHGVVLDGPHSRAYIEDPATQRVSGYVLGDPIGGGKLVRILEDRVVIGRPEGLVEIMLKDPAKPRPGPPAAPTTPGIPPAPPAPAGELAPRTPPQGPK
jgi:hypothetical protein